MTLRMATVAFVLAAAFAGVASAAPAWNGAGWCVIAGTIVEPFVWSGPYASKEACDPNRLANEEDADYVCEYLGTRPDGCV